MMLKPDTKIYHAVQMLWPMYEATDSDKQPEKYQLFESAMMLLNDARRDVEKLNPMRYKNFFEYLQEVEKVYAVSLVNDCFKEVLNNGNWHQNE